MVLRVSGIRHCLWQSLILFFFCGCRDHKATEISIVWENELPVAIAIPDSFFSHYPADSVQSLLTVHLEQHAESVLGESHRDEGVLIFKPLISFTRGLTYTIRVAGKSIGVITIPEVDVRDAPVVMAIYPTQDTLPLNLLKIYLEFSRPMREGQSLQHLVLLKNERDTVPFVFLDLQPELWNQDRTTLTVWLDPGRIKRDLQPNKKMGLPLEPFTSYRLIVRSDWMDTRGASLQEDFIKDFYVTSRDSISPNPDQWKIITPQAGTTHPLSINFFESLDAQLLREAIQVTDSEGDIIKGKVDLRNEDGELVFTPEEPWTAGKFAVHTESRLEDLAGNNLNRPFDRDIREKTERKSDAVFIRSFEIMP